MCSSCVAGYPSSERIPVVSYACFAVLLHFTSGKPARYVLRPEFDAGAPSDQWLLDTRGAAPFIPLCCDLVGRALVRCIVDMKLRVYEYNTRMADAAQDLPDAHCHNLDLVGCPTESYQRNGLLALQSTLDELLLQVFVHVVVLAIVQYYACSVPSGRS